MIIYYVYIVRKQLTKQVLLKAKRLVFNDRTVKTA